MKKIQQFFFKRGLRRQKERAIFELEKDLQYIETFKAEMLSLDETPLRKRMGELKRKEDRTDEEEQNLAGILEKIALSKAVKNEHEKTKQLIQDCKDYLTII